LVFTAFLLEVRHLKKSVEIKPVNWLVMSVGKEVT